MDIRELLLKMRAYENEPASNPSEEAIHLVASCYEILSQELLSYHISKLAS